MTWRWSGLIAIGVCACTRLPSPTITEAPEPAQSPEQPLAPVKPSVADTEVWIKPCAPDSEAFERATRELEAINQQIELLAPTDDPESHWRALKELLAGECFELRKRLGMDADDEAPSSGLALRTWWDEGGSVWIEQFLDPETTWVRPSVRVAFAPELMPDHPLADLLCPLADLDCDVRTRGWTLRANQAFEVHGERRWSRFRTRDEELPRVRDWGLCEELAINKSSELRYETWFRCIDHMTLRQSVFPIGGLRAPDTGWFVIRGRRGHHRFCDEIRAFDLATGSVHAVGSCSGLALRADGSVDGAQTNSGRVLQETSGRVPVDALREAVWMTLWSNEMPRNEQVLGGFGYSVPKMIEPMVRDGGFGIGIGGVTMSSGQTTLDWIYVRDGRPSVSGTLRWPEDYNNGAKDHAVRLLQIAEAAMVAGCAPARPPKISMGGEEAPSEIQRELEQALGSMKPSKCSARSRR